MLIETNPGVSLFFASQIAKVYGGAGARGAGDKRLVQHCTAISNQPDIRCHFVEGTTVADRVVS